MCLSVCVHVCVWVCDCVCVFVCVCVCAWCLCLLCCVLRTRPALCGVRIKDQTSAVWSVLCIKDQTSAVRSVLCVVSVPPLARLHPQDCAEIYRRGIVENGFYTIQPALQRPALEAKCDMQTAGGGWTVFQRRQDGSLDFNRTWQAYAEGFGSPPAGELWLGNAALHALTAAGGPHTLRIELEDWRQQRRHAVYSSFRVGTDPVLSRFRLTAREYSGDAGDALSYSARYNHDGRAFSTADRDHDRYAAGHCARYYGAGWWFDACLAANLNGRYYRGRYGGLTDGIYWGTWHALTDARTGERLSFKTVEMKTRPGPPRG
uniref:Si:ch211-157b11.8 n=1 Tax=Gadus morhua TaxID=8049 RepID=A0A8C5FUV2_GADMO